MEEKKKHAKVIDALINGQVNDVDIDLSIHFVFHKM